MRDDFWERYMLACERAKKPKRLFTRLCGAVELFAVIVLFVPAVMILLGLAAWDRVCDWFYKEDP